MGHQHSNDRHARLLSVSVTRHLQIQLPSLAQRPGHLACIPVFKSHSPVSPLFPSPFTTSSLFFTSSSLYPSFHCTLQDLWNSDRFLIGHFRAPGHCTRAVRRRSPDSTPAARDVTLRRRSTGCADAASITLSQPTKPTTDAADGTAGDEEQTAKVEGRWLMTCARRCG